MDQDNKTDDKDRSQRALDHSDHDSMADSSDNKSEGSGPRTMTKADALAAREMKELVMSRIMIAAILFFTAVFAGLTTYFVTAHEQVRDFETQVRTLFGLWEQFESVVCESLFSRVDFHISFSVRGLCARNH
jgi:hypothetical protein